MSKTLWQHVDSLTAKAFARYGFTYGDVLTRWPEIAGDRLAAVSQPERIRWPREAKANADADAGVTGARSARRAPHSGGTLVLKVAAGHALLVQHEIPTIIERVNTFYGYGAVTKVKIVADATFKPPQLNGAGMAPTPRPKQRAVPPAAMERVAESLDGIENPHLRAALERLGKGILQRQQDDATKP